MPNRGTLARVTLLTARDAFSSWNDAWQDSELLWSTVGPTLFACFASLAGGLLVVLLLNAPLLLHSSEQRASAPPAVLADSQRAAPTRIEVVGDAALFSPPIAVKPPSAVSVWTAVPVAAATSVPVSAVPMVAAVAEVPTVAAVPAVAVAETADAAWAAVLPSLDAAWGSDTPGTLALLNAFRARFPEFQPAHEKFYAALIATARDLAQRGASDEAEALLSEAAALLPNRAEAPAQLLALAVSRAPAEPPTQGDDALP